MNVNIQMKGDFMNTLGERLKFLRTQLKLSQDEVSQGTGISRSNISKIESNSLSPTAPAIAALSKFLNISADWLLTGESFTQNGSFGFLNEQKNPVSYDIDEVKDKFAEQAIITASVGTGKSLSILSLLTPEIKKSILLMPPPNKEELKQRLGRVNRTDLDNAVLKHLGVQDLYDRTIEPDILDAGPPDHKLMYFYSGVYDRMNYLMSRNRLHSLDLLDRVKEVLGPDIELTQKDILNIMDGYCLPDNYVLYAIAKILKVTPGWILYGDEIGDSNIRSNTNHNFEDARKIKAALNKLDLPLDIISKRLGISLYDLYEHMEGISISKYLLDKIAELCKVTPEWLSKSESNQSVTNKTDSHSDEQHDWTNYMNMIPGAVNPESLLSSFNEDIKQSLEAIVRNYITEMADKGITSKEELLADQNVSAILNSIIIDDDELNQKIDISNEQGQNSIFDNHERDDKKHQIINLLKNLPLGALEEIERYIKYIIFRLEGDQSKEEQAVTKHVETA